MSIDKISKIASSVSQYMNDNEKLSVAIMAARVRKALQDFPEDQTLVQMASVLTRMTGKKGFINRGEFRKMAQSLYTRNTRFNEIFASELNQDTVLKSPTFMSHEGDGDGTLAKDYAAVADPVLANALQSAFDGTAERNYSDKAALASVRKVAQNLSRFGLECRASVATGSPDCIIVDASFETPKGWTNVMVPVELHEGQPLDPSAFVSNRGSEDFTKDNFRDYIVSSAGQKLNVLPAQLLKIVNNIKSGSRQTVSSVELAITKFKAAQQAPQEFFVNSITGLDVITPVADVALPEVQDTEIQSFAQQFDSAQGRANFLHGERKMAEARKVIEMQLRGCGVKRAQLAVQDSGNDTVTFAVNVGQTAFSVPVKMAGQISANVLLCRGQLKEFNSQNVTALMAQNEQDHKAAAVASPLYHVKPSDLIQTVRVAMAESNYAKAEDALNVLAASGDDKAHAIAMQAYLGGLNKTAAPVKEECGCSRIMKTASSKFPVCGHTGLPTHKVYQDENGDCHPLYRKAMNESYEGAAFMTNKIFF